MCGGNHNYSTQENENKKRLEQEAKERAEKERCLAENKDKLKSK